MIWEYALVKMEISADKIPNFEAVLVVPDSFDQADVVDMLRILLERMRVRAVYIAKESVCCASGAALTSCCVVDIGFSCVLAGIRKYLTTRL
jgi:actin-related protein 8